MRIYLALALVVTLSSQALALPKLEDLNQIKGLDDHSVVSSRLLRDHQDEHLLYITPSYLDVARDRLTGELLFKLSLSQTAQDGELSSVLQLVYDQNSVASEWQTAKLKQAQLHLKKLPIRAGRFGVELETPEFSLLFGRSESVLSDLENGLIPLSIALHPEGIELLRALNSIPNQTLMFLNFSFTSSYFLDSQAVSTSVALGDLVRAIESDRFIREAWDKGLTPSQEALEGFLMRHYQRFWFTFGDQQPEVRVMAKLLIAALQEETGRLLNRPIDLALQADVLVLKSQIAAGNLESSLNLKVLGPGEIRDIENSVAMAFRNVCERYAQRVFVEETGASQCFDFEVIAEPPGDDDVWVPF